jgi:hypothetical protein
MGYNHTNKLMLIWKIQKLTQAHWIEGLTTYSWIYRNHIVKVYPISYKSYLVYINTSVPSEIKQLEKEQ